MQLLWPGDQHLGLLNRPCSSSNSTPSSKPISRPSLEASWPESRTRPRSLCQAKARATQLLLATFDQNGRQVSYTGVNEAISMNAEFSVIVNAHHMALRTLLQNMHSSHTTLKKRKEYLKPMMNTWLKDLRVSACSKLVKHSELLLLISGEPSGLMLTRCTLRLVPENSGLTASFR